LLEDPRSVGEGLLERIQVRTAAANMEAGANAIKSEFFSCVEQLGNVTERSTELVGQLANGPRVVGNDSENNLSVGRDGLDLVEFVNTVECHALNTLVLSEGQITWELAAISENYIFVAVGSRCEGQVNLVGRGAVETGS